ncbi:MAG: hypothetical protein KA248_05330 [Kiritimatiellae bacterium]|nr:hypothetical protein [Kiritimatiellia bacterium]
MMERMLRDTLWVSGPLTGAELLERARMDVLPLWRECRRIPALRRILFGRRYLRLDRAVDGYARLSPSIRREFLTYTVLGLKEQATLAAKRAEDLRRAAAAISQDKISLAREVAVSALAELNDDTLAERFCFLIAGDVMYNMAHRVPRPEKSTGEMVRGSDLDIVVVASDDLPADAIQALDAAIYRKKHYLLVHPDYREEVDYLVKGFHRVREQTNFDTFESMVACKIMDESRLLYGSRALFQQIKGLLHERQVPQRLVHLEAAAVKEREEAEQALLAPEERFSAEQYNHLFFTQEEGEEIY